MDNQPKISLPEAFILVIGALIIDIVPIICVLFGMPDFFIPGIISWISVFYLKMKGLSLIRDVVASALELIPYVSVLPAKTVVMCMTIWADRHPEGAIAKATEKAARAIPIKRPVATAVPAKAPGIKTPVGGLSKS
jgi:hypothetical protein